MVHFLIKREFRNNGLTSRPIEAAIGYAKGNGVEYIEAYPAAPDSSSYWFMGFMQTFEKAGFHFIKSAGSRKNVMIYALKSKA